MSALPHAFGHLLGDCQSLRKALHTLKIRTLVASGHPTGKDRLQEISQHKVRQLSRESWWGILPTATKDKVKLQ